MLNFKAVLYDLRKSRNITQDELAQALHVSRSTIANYEQGTREPNFETLEKIADYFNVSMSELLDDDQASRLLLYYQRLKPLIDKMALLDDVDKARIAERIDMLLESEKYK